LEAATKALLDAGLWSPQFCPSRDRLTNHLGITYDTVETAFVGYCYGGTSSQFISHNTFTISFAVDSTCGQVRSVPHSRFHLSEEFEPFLFNSARSLFSRPHWNPNHKCQQQLLDRVHSCLSSQQPGPCWHGRLRPRPGLRTHGARQSQVQLARPVVPHGTFTWHFYDGRGSKGDGEFRAECA
jgi:hypothetical protein